MLLPKFTPKTWRNVSTKSINTQKNIQTIPSCKDCKWSVDNGKLCILFKLNSNDDLKFSTKYIRSNTDLCGPEGLYFKEIQKEIK